MLLNEGWLAKWRAIFAPPGEVGEAVPETTDEPLVTAPEGEAEEGDEAAGEVETEKEEPKPEPKPIEQTAPLSRVHELVAQRAAEGRAREAAEARAQLAEEQLRQMRALAAGEDPEVRGARSAPVAGSPEYQAEVERGVAESRFNEQCNASALRARSAHDDFDSAIGALRSMAGGAVPRGLVEAVLDIGGEENAGEIMYVLGKDLARADEVLRLSPRKQVIALKELADGLKKPKSAVVSGAPSPIRPATGSGGNQGGKTTADGAKLSMEDWLTAREAEVAGERKRAGAR